MYTALGVYTHRLTLLVRTTKYREIIHAKRKLSNTDIFRRPVPRPPITSWLYEVIGGLACPLSKGRIYTTDKIVADCDDEIVADENLRPPFIVLYD